MKPLAIGLALCLMASSAMAAEPWFTAESRTLPNGLQVVVLPNHRAPIAHVSVWYKAGGANDPDEQSGVAHYLEHLMFRGNDEMKDGEYSATVKAWGGDENAFTSMDVTAYFATLPEDKLDKQLTMEASRMRQIAPDPKKAATEHEVIQQERAQTVGSDPNRVFAEQVNAQLYPQHPYGRPIIGTPKDIAALRLNYAKDFHKHWYGPDNAILVIAGDVEPDKAFALARKRFGGLDPIHPPLAPYKRHPINPTDLSIALQKCDARVEQPLISVNWTLPPRASALQTALTADVLAYILDGGSTSPLYKALVEQDKRVTALSVSYNDNTLMAGGFSLNVWPSPDERDYEAFTTYLKTRLDEIIASRITEDDVRRAITQLQLQFELASDQPSGLAMQLGYSLAMGETLDTLRQAPLMLDAVTLADVKRFAETYLFNAARAPLSSRLLPQGDSACQG